MELHKNLASKTVLVELPLCLVLLENERNYPWLIFVPKRPDVSRIMDLSFEDQVQLLRELDLGQKLLWEEYQPTQINVAALGNKTPQLHIHVIARFLNDPAWPATVWDHPVRARYSEEGLAETLEALRSRCDLGILERR